MAWDRKRRGPASGYFYLSVRTPDGVRKVYLGRGAAGHEAAADVERRKQQRRDARDALRAERDATAEADRLAAELREWAAVLAACRLVLTGHHRHRGQWRFRRG
jgi:phage/plasmid primase-like uncharacterized protein